LQNWFDERLIRQSDYLAELFVEAEAECRAQIWLVRVPSKSNAADHPSRGLTAKLKENNRVDHSDLAAVVLESWKLLHTTLKWGDERVSNSHSGKRKIALLFVLRGLMSKLMSE